MNKQQVIGYAANNGISASYSGKSATWHFSNGQGSVSRKVGKGLTAKMLDNTFKKI